mmetsp:Transcript_39924/g.44602  ORF Transcript_39924/g.44602 Transcript_39924/m.44602 type:complete len:163 (+) Transcript_39924:222-710(+)
MTMLATKISITEIKIEIDKNNTTCSVARVARLVYFQRKIKKMLYNNMQAEPNLLCGKILLLSRYRWEEHQCATTTTFQPRVQTAVDRPKGELYVSKKKHNKRSRIPIFFFLFHSDRIESTIAYEEPRCRFPNEQTGECSGHCRSPGGTDPTTTTTTVRTTTE